MEDERRRVADAGEQVALRRREHGLGQPPRDVGRRGDEDGVALECRTARRPDAQRRCGRLDELRFVSDAQLARAR
jgi:hypothetical protein